MIIPEDSSDLLTVSFIDDDESYSGCNESGYESFCGQGASGELNFSHLLNGTNHMGMFYK